MWCKITILKIKKNNKNHKEKTIALAKKESSKKKNKDEIAGRLRRPSLRKGHFYVR